MEKISKHHEEIEKLTAIINNQKAELIRLGETEKLLNTVLDVVAGIHWWKDKNGIYRGCNEAMVSELGLKSKDDIIGKSDYELPWVEQADALVHNDREVMSTRQIQKGKEELVKTKDGTIHTFMVAKAPLYDKAENVIGTAGNSIDITKQKKLEQELRKAKELAESVNVVKTEFIRNMEHDIRTPFHGIYAMAQALCDDETDLKKKEYLNEIAKAGKELLDFCNTILDFSKTELGLLPVLHKKFDLSNIIEKAIAMEQPAIHAKQLSFSCIFSENTPQQIIGDDYRLLRILINLLSNSVKFTKKGNITLSVENIKLKNKEVFIRFTVADTGIGIPEEKINFIYEKFTRVNPANRNLYKGLGLGLHIVKRFVEELEGEIEVTSEPNRGTIFNFFIPFKLPIS